MKMILLAIGWVAVAAFTPAAAQAQDAGAVYVVTYFELQPAAKRGAGKLLKALRDATRQDDGNLRAELLESAARPGQFVLLTAWKDQAALDAHMAAAHSRQSRDKLHDIRNSAADDRIHNPLSVAAAAAAERGGTARAVYVVTHVDVPPPRKDECVTMLKKLADDSRNDAGNLRYDVVQQTSRPNHFTLIQAWKTRKAFDAHAAAPHMREFRDQLTPMSGALYDERLYRAMK